jgi:hypothetical protein
VCRRTPAAQIRVWAIGIYFAGIAFLASCSNGHAGEYRLAWGDVHGHTILSDGKGTLDSYLTYARDVARLDFVMVTDHDFGNGAPWRMPKENWALIQRKVEEYSVDGQFIAVAGYEWTSAPKYWTDFADPTGKELSERHFPGPPKFYNHKNVYFPGPIDHIFSAKDSASNTPDMLADEVGRYQGLIQNNHPALGPEGLDQFDYSRSHESVIANTEILPDIAYAGGQTYHLNGERIVRDFLDGGRKTGFVKGTDTHEGRPAARTAVLIRGLTRADIFEALRNRRNYAVSRDRIILDFKINGFLIGQEIEIRGKPQIAVHIQGTAAIAEVEIIRHGSVLYRIQPKTKTVEFRYIDESFAGNDYYYLRVVQDDKDEFGNPSYAWSSPIWVKRKSDSP